MNGKDPIEEELGKAGVAPSVPPSVVKLDKFRIMSDTDVPPEEFLMRLFGKPCFPRRDISTVTGTEKCGKTFFTSMLMACCAEKNVLELERIRDEPLKVMWYDTEQSRRSPGSSVSRKRSITRLTRTVCLSSQRSLPAISHATIMAATKPTSPRLIRLRPRRPTRSIRIISSIMTAMPDSHGSGISENCFSMRWV